MTGLDHLRDFTAVWPVRIYDSPMQMTRADLRVYTLTVAFFLIMFIGLRG